MLDGLFESFGTLTDLASKATGPLLRKETFELIASWDHQLNLGVELLFCALHVPVDGLTFAEFTDYFDDLLTIRDGRAIHCQDDVPRLETSFFCTETRKDLVHLGRRVRAIELNADKSALWPNSSRDSANNPDGMGCPGNARS